MNFVTNQANPNPEIEHIIKQKKLYTQPLLMQRKNI